MNGAEEDPRVTWPPPLVPCPAGQETRRETASAGPAARGGGPGAGAGRGVGDEPARGVSRGVAHRVADLHGAGRPGGGDAGDRGGCRQLEAAASGAGRGGPVSRCGGSRGGGVGGAARAGAALPAVRCGPLARRGVPADRGRRCRRAAGAGVSARHVGRRDGRTAAGPRRITVGRRHRPAGHAAQAASARERRGAPGDRQMGIPPLRAAGCPTP